MTETTQTPAPTMVQLDTLLAARQELWDNFQCAPYRVPGYWAKKHQWDIACDDYAAAITRAALNHGAMTDGTKIQIQSAMLSPDGRSMNICIIPVPEEWLKRKY